jgi:hypothetical protein
MKELTVALGEWRSSEGDTVDLCMSEIPQTEKFVTGQWLRRYCRSLEG